VAQLYFIEVDHLDTPRLVADVAGTTVWRWDQQEPFGVNVPNENPSGFGAFEFPLRFAGQYAARETNLAYNYFRTYDPSTGRYQEPDPLGALIDENLYSYASAKPLLLVDPRGTEPGGYAQRGYWCSPDDEPGLEGVHPECSLPALKYFCMALGLGGSLGPKGKTGKQRDGTPKSNQAQNKRARDAAREAGGLDKDQQNTLHDAIHNQNLDYHEILEIAKDIKNGKF